MRRLVVWFGVLAVTLVTALVGLSTSTALAASTPSATTGTATGVTQTAAALAGSVNLQGASLDGALAAIDTGAADATGCYFEYGTTTSYGSYVSCTPTPTNALTTAQAVAAALTGLEAGTAYHYRLVIQVASDSLLGIPVSGMEYDGADATFTTPTTTATPTAATSAASAVSGTSATLNGTVNPENYTVSSCEFSYAASGGAASTSACVTTPSGSTSQTVSAPASGLSQGTAYSYTLTITYAGGSTVTSSATSFTTLAAAIAAPASLTATTATLTATVNPEGQTVTGCTFYYGTSGPTLQTTPCSTAASQISGTSNVSISAAVTGLTQSTGYLDTVVVTTSDGSVTAVPAAFTTLTEPKATSAAATAITTTTAKLNATVNLGGQGIQACGFEWGVNPLSSTTTGNDLALVEPCATSPGPNGNQATSVTLKGLAPGTTYYFRVIVTTYGGYAIGNTESFKTLKNTAKPAMTIKSAKINTKAKSAKFTFARTGTVAVTKGFQCALVTVTKGKAATAHYAACKSGRTYTKLKAKTYVFSVRGANAAGYSKVVSHKFTI